MTATVSCFTVIGMKKKKKILKLLIPEDEMEKKYWMSGVGCVPKEKQNWKITGDSSSPILGIKWRDFTQSSCMKHIEHTALDSGITLVIREGEMVFGMIPDWRINVYYFMIFNAFIHVAVMQMENLHFKWMRLVEFVTMWWQWSGPGVTASDGTWIQASSCSVPVKTRKDLSLLCHHLLFPECPRHAKLCEGLCFLSSLVYLVQRTS